MGFDIDLLGPSEEDEDALAHYGVKGMRWGHHKAPDESSDSSGSSKSGGSSGSSTGSSSSKEHEGLSDGQKKALKYAAGGALVAGALIGTAVLARNGQIPIKSLQTSAFNKNSFAAETKRLEKIPGTYFHEAKMARTPGTRQFEMKKLAQIPGTLANREAQLAKAAETSATMKPEVRVQFMQRVTARLDAEQERRVAVQTARAQRIAKNAASEARTAEMASRRQIVANLGRAQTRSGDRNIVQQRVDPLAIRRDSRRATRAIDAATDAQQRAQSAADKKKEGPSRMENAQTLLQAAAMGREAVSSIRNSSMWNQPASSVSSSPTQSQRQQIVAAQRRAAESERQNGSRRGRN